MKRQRLSKMFIQTSAALSLFMFSMSTTFGATPVTVDRAVHVTTAEGSDLVLDVGDYVLEPAQEWLRITPSSGNAVDAHLLDAQVEKHNEKLTNPLALSVPGVEADSHHLVLLLPDGQSLAVHGSYSGIRSRAGSRKLTRAKMQQIIALSKKKKKAQKTEYKTPRMGGTGGNRSYNLDCGNEAVLVGGISKAGSWLDALGIICQRVNPQSGQLGDEFTKGPVGGSGGSARHARCRNGHVVEGVKVFSGQFVNGIQLYCGRWNPSRRATPISRTSCRGTDRICPMIAGLTSSSMRGGTARNSVFSCPTGKVGKAFRGRYGIYIDSTQFVCDFWDK
ncbi:MAG: hypothetical protein ACPGYT_06860 [Nitrospirales bacterium]